MSGAQLTGFWQQTLYVWCADERIQFLAQLNLVVTTHMLVKNKILVPNNPKKTLFSFSKESIHYLLSIKKYDTSMYTNPHV